MKGREHKKSGSVSFRGGQHETAVKEFSQALKHMPWDVSLYTNRALVRMSTIFFTMYVNQLSGIKQAYNQLGRYTEAIADCDAALKVCIVCVYVLCSQPSPACTVYMLQLEPHTLKAHLQKAKALTHLRRLVEVY